MFDFLFYNQNSVVDENTMSEVVDVIDKNEALAFVGKYIRKNTGLSTTEIANIIKDIKIYSIDEIDDIIHQEVKFNWIGALLWIVSMVCFMYDIVVNYPEPNIMSVGAVIALMLYKDHLLRSK